MLFKRSFAIVAAASLGAALAAGAQATPITLSNATTQVDVYGGEADNGLVPYGGFFRYTDLGSGEETTWSIDPVLVGPDGDGGPSVTVLSNGSAGGFGSPVDQGGGIVRSSTTVGTPQGDLLIDADTQLIGSNARTTFTFTPQADNPVGYRFVFYAELDLFDADDDVAEFTGSIAGGDLTLFQYDSADQGLTVVMTASAGQGSELTLFGADLWTGFGEALEGGDLSVLSADGSNFVTEGDLALVFAFDLTFASPATLTINFDTQPLPPGVALPEPSALALLGLGLLGLGLRRRWLA